VAKTRIVAITLALAIAAWPGLAQQSAPAQPASTGAPASQQELDQLLAPIALYPDALLVQILMASTYPLEVVMASRWAKANPGVSGKALEDAMQKETWAPEVKAVTAVPQVLERMSENLGWIHKLGDAFLADQKAVLQTVQALRGKAQAAGNLKTTQEQVVRTEVQESKSVIIIEPAKPEVVYVPTYDPNSIYGPWWYSSYPPYYMYPPGYYYGTGMAFAAGVFWGAAIWGGCNWGGGNVNINRNNYNNFNRANIGSGNWNHNVDHRKGVAYGDNRVAQRYDRGGNTKAVQSREQFRARADQGRAQMQGMDRASLQNQVGAADRAGAGNRAGTSDRAGASDRMSSGAGQNRAGTSDLGGRSGSVGSSDSRGRGGDYSSRGSGSGLSGAGSGSSSRAASSRGSSSRGSMGGGGRGGGGGRR
jgi:uncharacterized membrane protein YgcG